MNSSNKSFLRTLAGLACLAAAGCATTGGGGKHVDEDNSVIRDRAIERWHLLVDKKAEQAYDFLTPGYQATKTRDQYAREMNARGVRWSNVSFGSQECAADKCTVRLLVDYKINMKGAMGTVQTTGPVVETWIKTDGKWRYLPDAMQSNKLQQEGQS